jgi:hypothetical protein
MTPAGMQRFEATVRAAVASAPDLLWSVLANDLITQPDLLLGAWEELKELGSQSRDRESASVEAARELVNEVLIRDLPFPASEWRNVVAVALGMVDVIARESLKRNRQRHDGDAR